MWPSLGTRMRRHFSIFDQKDDTVYTLYDLVGLRGWKKYFVGRRVEECAFNVVLGDQKVAERQQLGRNQ